MEEWLNTICICHSIKDIYWQAVKTVCRIPTLLCYIGFKTAYLTPYGFQWPCNLHLCPVQRHTQTGSLSHAICQQRAMFKRKLPVSNTDCWPRSALIYRRHFEVVQFDSMLWLKRFLGFSFLSPNYTWEFRSNSRTLCQTITEFLPLFFPILILKKPFVICRYLVDSLYNPVSVLSDYIHMSSL